MHGRWLQLTPAQLVQALTEHVLHTQILACGSCEPGSGATHVPRYEVRQGDEEAWPDACGHDLLTRSGSCGRRSHAIEGGVDVVNGEGPGRCDARSSPSRAPAHNLTRDRSEVTRALPSLDVGGGLVIGGRVIAGHQRQQETADVIGLLRNEAPLVQAARRPVRISAHQ